ncbi:hypothetical protein SRHO_G00049140 [Serrasalmus rhombeus]
MNRLLPCSVETEPSPSSDVTPEAPYMDTLRHGHKQPRAFSCSSSRTAPLTAESPRRCDRGRSSGARQSAVFTTAQGQRHLSK